MRFSVISFYLATLLLSYTQAVPTDPLTSLSPNIEARARNGGDLSRHIGPGYCFNVATHTLNLNKLSGLREAVNCVLGRFDPNSLEPTQCETTGWLFKIYREQISNANPSQQVITSLRALWDDMKGYLSRDSIPEHMQGSVGSFAQYYEGQGTRIFVEITNTLTHDELKPRSIGSEAAEIFARAKNDEICRDDASTNSHLYEIPTKYLNNPAKCGDKPPCSNKECKGIGIGGEGSNDGACRGDLFSCPCRANVGTPGHCGPPGPCGKKGCNGAYSSRGGYVCTGAFIGCPCNN